MGWLFLSLVLLAVGVLVSRARMYGQLFGDDHFVEIGRGLARVRAAAFERATEGDDGEPSRDDPRAVLTSSDLLVVYTVKQREDGFVHHCSVGATKSVTAHTVGETFVLFTAKVLRLPIEKMSFGFSETTVHHGEAVLDEVAHGEIVAAPVVVVTTENVGELRRAVMEARPNIRWH